MERTETRQNLLDHGSANHNPEPAACFTNNSFTEAQACPLAYIWSAAAFSVQRQKRTGTMETTGFMPEIFTIQPLKKKFANPCSRL